MARPNYLKHNINTFLSHLLLHLNIFNGSSYYYIVSNVCLLTTLHDFVLLMESCHWWRCTMNDQNVVDMTLWMIETHIDYNPSTVIDLEDIFFRVFPKLSKIVFLYRFFLSTKCNLNMWILFGTYKLRVSLYTHPPFLFVTLVTTLPT